MVDNFPEKESWLWYPILGVLFLVALCYAYRLGRADEEDEWIDSIGRGDHDDLI